MPRAYSMDLRTRVVAAVDAVGSTKDVACRFEVSARWISLLLRRRRETGEFGIRNGTRGPKPKLAPYRDQLLALVAKQPDATLHELRDQLDVRVSIASLSLRSTTWQQRSRKGGRKGQGFHQQHERQAKEPDAFHCA